MITSKQEQILQHFLRGDSLTVLKCIKMYHTTELRKVVSRINKKFRKYGKRWVVIGQFLNNDVYKTYQLFRW